jgi:ATP phosphoribosyltransferase
VRLSGSVEVAPQLGTADAIADLVSTGTTLRANQLREVETISHVQAAIFRHDAPLHDDGEALVGKLLKRIDGVQQAAESKYVMLHAPRSAVEKITALLPGAESPTILPLDGADDRVALHAVCREGVFWDHIEELREAGATAVLVLPIEKMLA